MNQQKISESDNCTEKDRVTKHFFGTVRKEFPRPIYGYPRQSMHCGFLFLDSLFQISPLGIMASP